MTDDYYPYIQKWFERWAPFYDFIDNFIAGIRTKVVSIANLKKGSKILDVCTGTGKQAFAFGKENYDVVGIDLSEAMLSVANKKNRYATVRFETSDATKLPFKDCGFDASCISFSLHDMPLNIRKKVLDEIVRVTKLKGYIIIVDYDLPNNSLLRSVGYYLIRFYESKYYPEYIKSNLEQL